EMRAEMRKNAEQIKRKGHAIFENVHMTNDGRRIPVEVSNHLIDFKGKKAALTVVRDITKRKEMEKQLKETINELKETLKELERSNKELEQFAYVSSHDLQEPLRTIASFTQLLERRYKGKLDSDADEFMDYIVEAAVRMKEQIEGLLEYSRVATKGEKFKPVNMNEIINQTIKSLNISIKETNTNIKVDELPNVMGDGNQLQRVFQNLISNAIKFRKHKKPLKLRIYANKDIYNKEYVFGVQDNGIGIEEQYRGRIFTIFQRLHTRDVYKGTGIGLSIVKRIIERHGGRVWVESEFDDGSTFYFTLPIK
ncbi:sensor histidine kinase, partial [Methanobacterium sp.]|uniref:sensor histidine kinase n=1 Tax=Methanobacterium sp. TaxID=2164 RepID=UPI003C7487F2